MSNWKTAYRSFYYATAEAPDDIVLAPQKTALLVIDIQNTYLEVDDDAEEAARWAPFRPYIIATAAVMLAWAFWRVYRPQSVCEDGSCPTGPSTWLKVMLWVAALMIALAK